MDFYNKHELKKYPMCDTDIWVDINLVHSADLLFKKYKKIIVADVVEGEIRRFKANANYDFIVTTYEEYKKRGEIIVIENRKLSAYAKALFEKQLLDLSYNYGFSFNGLDYNPKEQHKGEIISAMYAKYFKVLFLKSNDGTFKDGNAGRLAFPTLLVKDRKHTLKDLLNNDTLEIEYFYRIKDERDLMNEGTNRYENDPVTMDSVNDLLGKLRGKSK